MSIQFYSDINLRLINIGYAATAIKTALKHCESFPKVKEELDEALYFLNKAKQELEQIRALGVGLTG